MQNQSKNKLKNCVELKKTPLRKKIIILYKIKFDFVLTITITNITHTCMKPFEKKITRIVMKRVIQNILNKQAFSKSSKVSNNLNISI